MEASTGQDHVVALCSKMNEYRCNDEYSDIDLRVEGISFKCHRLVLGAASKYFHIMFTGKFKERTAFVVTLKEIQADTFDEILQFIYTGNVSINPDNLYGLFYASEYYSLPGLEKACVKYIRECTSSLVENVSQMYSFFRAMGKEEVADILDDNIFDHFDNFYRTPEFLKISIDDLRRILEKIKDYVPSNHDIFHKAIMRWAFYADSHSPEEKRKCSDELIKNIDFTKLSGQYLKYITGRCIERSNIDVVRSTRKTDRITRSRTDEKYSVEPRLHAFANNHYYDDSGDLIYTSELFSRYEEHETDFRWIYSHSFKHFDLPSFMRTVKVDNDLYCLSYDEYATGEQDDPAQKFITTSSVSLFPKSYLTSPPLELRNFEMCRINGNIYFYNKDALSNVVRNVENSSANFNEESLSRAVYLYNTETDAWLPLPPLKQKYANACMTSSEQMLYLVGGTNSYRYVQGYDYRTSKWMALASTSGIFDRAACCVSKAELYVSGGCINQKKVEKYNPTAAKWTNEADMILGLSNHEILLDENGNCITYSELILPQIHNVFTVDGSWSSSMYDDLIKSTNLLDSNVIHMSLFKPYGF